MDELECRTLFTSDKLMVVGVMCTDDYSTEPDGDCYSAEDVERFGRTWGYVGMRVDIAYDGVTIATDDLWSIDHGDLGDGITTDAWELTPSDYTAGVNYMGSPLSGVVCEALDKARKWAATAATADSPLMAAILAAQQWADPNAHKRNVTPQPERTCQ